MSRIQQCQNTRMFLAFLFNAKTLQQNSHVNRYSSINFFFVFLKICHLINRIHMWTCIYSYIKTCTLFFQVVLVFVASWTKFSCSNSYKIHLKLLKFLSLHEQNSNVSKCTIFYFFLSSFNFRSLLIHKKIMNIFKKKSSKDSKSSKTIWCMCINKFTFKVVPKLWQQRQSLFLAHHAWRSFACPKSHACKEIFHLFWIFFINKLVTLIYNLVDLINPTISCHMGH